MCYACYACYTCYACHACFPCYACYANATVPAAAALGDASVSSVVRKVAARVGHAQRVTLVPGYFNDSLSDELLRDRKLRPALLVDMDADIYLSAIQALDWLFAKRLIVPSTFVRYDDWPRFNATHGRYKGTNFLGQARAHYELSEKWDVRWKLVATGTVQVVSIGADVCPASLCGKAPALREVLHMGESHLLLLLLLYKLLLLQYMSIATCTVHRSST